MEVVSLPQPEPWTNLDRCLESWTERGQEENEARLWMRFGVSDMIDWVIIAVSPIETKQSIAAT
jgi:hypothetical protein